MSELEEQLRRYGEAVEQAACGAEPEVFTHPVDRFLARRSRSWLVAGFLVAAAAITAFVVLPDRHAGTQVAAVDQDGTSTTDNAETTSSAPFDLEAFAASKLNGALDQTADAVAVVVVIPADDSRALEAAIGSLAELAGYSMVPAEDLVAAASTFAAGRRSESLDGSWVAYGLMPQLNDSPVSDWVDSLRSSYPRAVVVGTDFRVSTQPAVPSGWTPLTDLPIGALEDPVVAAVGDLVVVLARDSTLVVHPDGTVNTAPASPLDSADSCCPGVHAVNELRSAVVFPDDQSGEAWIFEAERLAWTRLEDRPNAQFDVLGAAVVDGRLIVVSAAPRSGQAISPVDELDLTTGSWRALDPLPVPISVGTVLARDAQLVVSGTLQGPNNNIIGGSEPSVLLFDGDAGWSLGQPAPISGQAAAVVPLPGGALLAFNYGREAALADRVGNWTRVDDVPMPESECYPHATPVAGGVVAFCGGVAWWDPTTVSWTQIQAPTFTLVALSDGLVALVDRTRDSTSLLFYPLPPG